MWGNWLKICAVRIKLSLLDTKMAITGMQTDLGLQYLSVLWEGVRRVFLAPVEDVLFGACGTRLFVCLFVCLSVCFVDLFVRSFVRLFVHAFARCFVRLHDRSVLSSLVGSFVGLLLPS